MQYRLGLCAALLACALGFVDVQPSSAGGEWPDSPHRAWFKQLQRPDNHLHTYRDEKSKFCCDIADTVDTQFKVESTGGPYPEDTWYAWLEGKWEKISPEKIVPDFAPDGRAYLFLMGRTIQCFVKPKGGI